MPVLVGLLIALLAPYIVWIILGVLVFQFLVVLFEAFVALLVFLGKLYLMPIGVLVNWQLGYGYSYWNIDYGYAEILVYDWRAWAVITFLYTIIGLFVRRMVMIHYEKGAPKREALRIATEAEQKTIRLAAKAKDQAVALEAQNEQRRLEDARVIEVLGDIIQPTLMLEHSPSTGKEIAIYQPPEEVYAATPDWTQAELRLNDLYEGSDKAILLTYIDVCARKIREQDDFMVRDEHTILARAIISMPFASIKTLLPTMARETIVVVAYYYADWINDHNKNVADEIDAEKMIDFWNQRQAAIEEQQRQEAYYEHQRREEEFYAEQNPQPGIIRGLHSTLTANVRGFGIGLAGVSLYNDLKKK